MTKKRHILIGEKYAELLGEALKNSGFEPIFIPDNPLIDHRLSGHADLSVFYPGGGEIFLAPFLKGSGFSEKVSRLGLRLIYTEIKQAEKYPFDAQMNACLIGRRLFYSKNVTAGEISNYFCRFQDFELINCKQGYLSCTVCKVDDNSFICADRGVERAGRRAGLETLLISPGFIELPGFEYGFIGGAAFKTENRLIFTGNLNRHPDRERIMEFAEERNVKTEFLTELPALDIGGAVII